MQIEIFTVCDSFQNYGGKFVIVGTFNRIYSQHYPFVFPHLSIVGRIACEESGNINFLVTFENAEGEEVVKPIQWSAEVNYSGEIVYADFSLDLNQIHFKKPGLYLIKLYTGEEERIFKLYLKSHLDTKTDS